METTTVAVIHHLVEQQLLRETPQHPEASPAIIIIMPTPTTIIHIITPTNALLPQRRDPQHLQPHLPLSLPLERTLNLSEMISMGPHTSFKSHKIHPHPPRQCQLTSLAEPVELYNNTKTKLVVACLPQQILDLEETILVWVVAVVGAAMGHL